MRIHDLPTKLVHDLAARCSGLLAASGDRRLIYEMTTRACYEEIEQRVEGQDFPLIAEESAAKIAALIAGDFPEFNKVLFELEK